MLEKLFRSRSFGTTTGHLAHYQVTHLASSRGLSLPSMIQHVTLALLKCWALITLALVFHFQHDDHPTILDAMAHAKIGIYPF
jgi:hypothetical protein